MSFKCWVCHRLKEPSTWAALSVPFATWGSQMPEPYSYYIFSVAALCGVLAIILKEGKDGVSDSVVETDSNRVNRPKPANNGVSKRKGRVRG